MKAPLQVRLVRNPAELEGMTSDAKLSRTEGTSQLELTLRKRSK